MGDCRIRIVIAGSLLLQPPPAEAVASDGGDGDGDGGNDRGDATRTSDSSSSGGGRPLSTVRLYSADTTLREVVEGSAELWALYATTRPSVPPRASKPSMPPPPFSLWDCTRHPPADITSWPLDDFPDLLGPKSRTLHNAGWFPSGTLLALPRGVTPTGLAPYLGGTGGGSDDPYADVQYSSSKSSSNISSNTSAKVEFKVEFKDPPSGPPKPQATTTTAAATSSSGSTSVPLPSQVLASVAERFSDDDGGNRDGEVAEAMALRRLNQQHKRQRQQERATKLEQRIALLEGRQEQQQHQGGTKGGRRQRAVSDQVLRMLVKSRATGDGNLKLRDRVYFQCLLLLLLDDGGGGSAAAEDDSPPDDAESRPPPREYRYFSPQDTFAKIAGTFSGPGITNSGCRKEVLCRIRKRRSIPPEEEGLSHPAEDEDEDGYVFRRFPPAMRVYEATSGGYLAGADSQAVDTLIVRWYDHPDEATPSVLQHDDDDVDDEDGDYDGADDGKGSGARSEGPDDVEMSDAPAPAAPSAQITEDATVEAASPDPDVSLDDPALLEAVSKLDDDNKGTKASSKKPSSAATLKVKHMKMKSKAKGDAKRIPKMDDRFFLEVVVVSDEGGQIVATSDCYFLAKTDSLERILQYVPQTKPSSQSRDGWEFLVLNDDGKFSILKDVSTSMLEAEECGSMKSFGRLILRPSRTQL